MEAQVALLMLVHELAPLPHVFFHLSTAITGSPMSQRVSYKRMIELTHIHSSTNSFLIQPIATYMLLESFPKLNDFFITMY